MTALLLDTSSLAYRAVHAVGPDRSSRVFVSMIQSLIGTYRPEAILFAKDSKRETLDRTKIHQEYKAGRTHDPNISFGVREIERGLSECGSPVVQVEGAEADDVLASAADILEGVYDLLIIVSEDKDLYQAVRPNVRLLKGGKLQGEEEVKERWSVDASRVPHVQALCGDTADNIPGLEGVGPKTAAKLINKYGSVEQVYSNRSTLTKSLSAQLDTFPWKRNLSLTTLRTDLALPIKLSELERPINWNRF
jgi:DNA polymerase-1